MKKTIIAAAMALFACLGSEAMLAQDDTVDRVTVELTDPAKPASLQVFLINGGITVTGYDGKEIVVEAKTDLKKIGRSERVGDKARGMTRIPVTSSSLTVEEYKNHVEISTESWKNAIDLKIKVPRNTSLKLNCTNRGDIRVEGVSGEIVAENTNGYVTLLDISGSAVAHALNKDVTVTFKSVDPDEPMSFSSLNGDIDVTFPPDFKALVKLKTEQGEIYSDFQITEVENPQKIVRKNERTRDGKYQVQIDRSYWGTINGGSREVQFTNFNGDIYIRKGK